MGMYDTSNLFPYDNEVIELKIENQLTTKLDMYQFATADYSLAENPGNVKKVRTYIGTGDVEDVAMGNGNVGDIGAGYVEKEYRVQYTQGRFPYYDEQVDADPTAIDAGVQRLYTSMTNDLTSKVIGEFKKASLISAVTDWDFDEIVDAIAKLPEEENEGLFLLVNKAQVAALRKNLKDSLQYVEAFVRTGYIGSICGVPVYESNAVPANFAFLANKEAVTIFMKKGAGVAQERDENTRKNTVYARKSSVVALTNPNKVVMLGREQATAATITTKASAAKTVAGAATTGASVTVYVNGVAGTPVTAANNAYTFTAAENLVAGDKIKVVAVLDGYLDSVVEAEAV